jgi:hypothetical protein
VRGLWLVLSGEPDPIINNLAVLSDVCPGYAPAGQSLIAATVVGNPILMKPLSANARSPSCGVGTARKSMRGGTSGLIASRKHCPRNRRRSSLSTTCATQKAWSSVATGAHTPRSKERWKAAAARRRSCSGNQVLTRELNKSPGRVILHESTVRPSAVESGAPWPPFESPPSEKQTQTECCLPRVSTVGETI